MEVRKVNHRSKKSEEGKEGKEKAGAAIRIEFLVICIVANMSSKIWRKSVEKCIFCCAIVHANKTH